MYGKVILYLLYIHLTVVLSWSFLLLFENMRDPFLRGKLNILEIFKYECIFPKLNLRAIDWDILSFMSLKSNISVGIPLTTHCLALT